MATAAFDGIRITGLACAVPTRTDRIYDFAGSFGGESVEKFIATTGVRERRFVHEKQTNCDLCFTAAERLLAHKGYERESVDGLVLVTQTPDYARPATAHVLHKRLGLTKDCMVFDVNLGCSGFVYGLNIVGSMLRAGALRRVLLCCGEAHNCLCDTGDKATSMLFGDAGSAVLLEPGEGSIRTLLKADGEGYRAILTAGLNSRVKVDLHNIDFSLIKETMDGSAVFEFAIVQVPRAFKEFFQTFGGGIDCYDYCVFHQANLFMLEHIRKKIKLDPAKMPVSMDRYGNTSSVSIPLTIADLAARPECPETLRLIASGFGVGLSWGVADFTLSKGDILPIIETDDYFQEAFVGTQNG